MKYNFFIWLTISIIIMILLPWLTVTFVKGDAGMPVCFLLFYVLNPIYSIIIGIFAGKNIKEMWSMPIISVILFLVGTWIFFDMGESAFFIYAALYLVIGICFMIFSIISSNF